MTEPVVLVASRRHACALSFAPDDSHVLTGGMEGSLRLFETGTWGLRGDWGGHDKSVNSLSYSPDGQRLASGSSDGTVRIRDAASGDTLEILDKYSTAVYAPKAPYMVLLKARGERIDIRDGTKGEVTASFVSGLKKNGPPVFLDATRFLVGGFDESLHVFRVPDGAREAELGGHETSVIGVSPLPDGRVATSDYAGTVRIWNVETATVDDTFTTGGRGYVYVEADPTGRFLATTAEKQVSLWTLAGERLIDLPVPVKGVYGLCFDSKAHWLANAAADGKVRVWDLEELGLGP